MSTDVALAGRVLECVGGGHRVLGPAVPLL